MYKNILVPLDGSELAESVLANVTDFARRHEANVVILRVAYAHLFPGADLSNSQVKAVGEAEDYTEMIQKRLEEEGLRAEAHVRYGFPAEEILEHVKRNDVELIAMATHGRSGPARWMLGSVAEQVLRHSPVPVLLVRSGMTHEAEEGPPLTAEVDERRKVS